MSADNAGAGWDPIVLAGHFQSIAEQSQKLMLRFLVAATRRRTFRHGRPVRPRRRLSRSDDQDDERSVGGRCGADRSLQRQHDRLAPRRRTHAQHSERGPSAAEGQAVQPPGVERERDVQLHPRELSRRFEIAAVDGASASRISIPQTARKVDFYTRQFVDAMSPSNFIATNPEVLSATLNTGGENLLRGLEHVLADLDHGEGRLQIAMTDTNAFRLGENIAATPCKVDLPERAPAAPPV